jgi:prevent-host-death family protein
MNPADIDRCSLTDLRRRTSACIARARDSGHPLFITRRGTVVAVLLSLEQYELIHREDEEIAAFVRRATTLTLARVEADERAARAEALKGSLKGAKVDEDDYRRYLEEKYR